MLNTSFQVAKFFGIPVQVHWTFGLVFIWVFYVGLKEGLDWQGILWSTVFVLLLFVCVVLHEFGHALTARRYGVDTRDIILSPIGGVARLDRLPEKPVQELVVALAGPMVNIAIALLLVPYFFFTDASTLRQLSGILFPSSNVFIHDLGIIDYFFFGLIILNLTLAVFNLLPAFPMDGGRVLRALLSLRFGRTKATRFATYVGQVLAIALIFYGIWNESIITAFIGVFVFTTAATEYRMVRMADILENTTVGEVLRRNFTPLYHTDPLDKGIEEMKQGDEKHFLVFDEWHNLVGLLPENRILDAARKNETHLPVDQFMIPAYELLLPSDSLKAAFGKLQNRQRNILPVYDNGRLAGVIDIHGIHHFLKRKK